MGIYDRDYERARIQRRPFARAALSVNKWLILINVAVFVIDALIGVGLPVRREAVVDRAAANARIAETAQWFVARTGEPAPPAYVRTPGAVLRRPLVDTASGRVVGTAEYVVAPPLNALGHFSTHTGYEKLQVWRLVTYQFLHGGLVHLAMNMLGLWIFGGMVEAYFGARRYAALYLVCGIFGGLCFLLLNLLGHYSAGWGLPRLPGLLFESKYTPLVGASAGVFGIIMASAYIAPNEKVLLLFPPVPLRLKYLAYGYVVIAALNLIFGGTNAGGDAAHIGGALAGYFFSRRIYLLRDFFDVFKDSRREKPRGPRAPQPDERELDRILAKVSTQGLQSLTAGERRTLRESTRRRST